MVTKHIYAFSKMFIYKYYFANRQLGPGGGGGPGCLGIWVRDNYFFTSRHLGLPMGGPTCQYRQLGPGGTQLPRHLGPRGPKMGGGGGGPVCL